MLRDIAVKPILETIRGKSNLRVLSNFQASVLEISV